MGGGDDEELSPVAFMMISLPSIIKRKEGSHLLILLLVVGDFIKITRQVE